MTKVAGKPIIQNPIPDAISISRQPKCSMDATSKGRVSPATAENVISMANALARFSINQLATVTTKNKNFIDKKLLNKMKPNSCFVLMSRAAVVNFKDLINTVKKRNIFVATDVFPEEPVPKKSSLRKVKNILFSAHRAGALKSAFFNMGEIVLKDMSLIRKNLKPKFCKTANKRTVNLIASKPVAIN